MISLSQKKNCCGCASCIQICPKKCISFEDDFEGFLYPKVNKDTCIRCGLCEQVCPILHCEELPTRKPMNVYAAKNKDDGIRMHSSSGGIFSLLAEDTIRQGGVVFGARFEENWEVVHDYVETVEGISAFRGSKYVQSKIGNNFINVKRFLQEGRKVMFTGTPCQVAGLQCFLKKEYDNLLCVDFVCHGVPSPKVWRTYLKHITHQKRGKFFLNFINNSKNNIESINFRDKSTGWKKYSFAYTISTTTGKRRNTNTFLHVFHNDPYMQAFLHDVILRPSCYDCKFRCQRSGSDLTIGDFWGIDIVDKSFDDDKGVSLLIIKTEKGQMFFPQSAVEKKRVSYDDATKANPSLLRSPKMHGLRNYFFLLLPYCRNFSKLIGKTVNRHPGYLYRFLRKAMILK